MGVGLRGVRWGISDSPQIALQSPCYGFATVFNVLLITSTLGKVTRLKCGLLTYPCGVLSMWAYVLWAFVRVGFCPDTDTGTGMDYGVE